MRSKPDQVDQPERTVHYDCAMCIAEMLHNTRLWHRDSSANIALPPDQHHCSDEAKWRIGGDGIPGELLKASDSKGKIELFDISNKIYMCVVNK